MNKPKQKEEIKGYDTKKMRVTPDGQRILIGTAEFKRIILPSIAVRKQLAAMEMDDLAEI